MSLAGESAECEDPGITEQRGTSHLAANLVAAHARHADVQEDYLGRIPSGRLEGGFAVGGEVYVVSNPAQQYRKRLATVFLIVDDQGTATIQLGARFRATRLASARVTRGPARGTPVP